MPDLGGSNSGSPLSNDAKLHELLQNVDSIRSDEALASWRKSFIQAYQKYLDPDGVLNARDADNRLVKKLQMLTTHTLKIQPLIDSRNISKEQVTAEGWNAIKNWQESMTQVERSVNQFCPKTSTEEDQVGYDKFELGAVLIKDGFHAYEIMMTTKEIIEEMSSRPPLDTVLDRNAKSILDFYSKSIQSFVDVMADLGLMGLAKQCMSIYKDTKRPLPHQPGPNGEPPQEDYSEFVGQDSDDEEEGDEEEDDDGEGENTMGRDPDQKSSSSLPDPSDEVEPDKMTPGKSGGKSPSAPESSTPSSTPSNKKDGKRKKNGGKGEDETPTQPKNDKGGGGGGGGAGGGGGGSELVIYWDPTTNSFGKIKRDKIASLVLFENDKGEQVNKGVIEEKQEREKLIWLLKKLERKVEKENKARGSWLDDIKKEKTASGGASPPPPSTRASMSSGERAGSKSPNVTRKKPEKAASERPTASDSWTKSPSAIKKKPVRAASERLPEESDDAWGKNPLAENQPVKTTSERPSASDSWTKSPSAIKKKPARVSENSDSSWGKNPLADRQPVKAASERPSASDSWTKSPSAIKKKPARASEVSDTQWGKNILEENEPVTTANEQTTASDSLTKSPSAIKKKPARASEELGSQWGKNLLAEKQTDTATSEQPTASDSLTKSPGAVKKKHARAGSERLSEKLNTPWGTNPLMGNKAASERPSASESWTKSPSAIKKKPVRAASERDSKESDNSPWGVNPLMEEQEPQTSNSKASLMKKKSREAPTRNHSAPLRAPVKKKSLSSSDHDVQNKPTSSTESGGNNSNLSSSDHGGAGPVKKVVKKAPIRSKSTSATPVKRGSTEQKTTPQKHAPEQKMTPQKYAPEQKNTPQKHAPEQKTTPQKHAPMKKKFLDEIENHKNENGHDLPKKKKSIFSDFQGSYKKAATKPTSDGWASVSGKFGKGG